MNETKTNDRTVSGRDTGPVLQIYNELEDAGFEKGDKVTIIAGNGYIVVTPKEAEVPISEVNVEDRPNVSDVPIESDLEARIVGNRLWQIGEQYDTKGDDHIAKETKELSRRFHKFANTDG